MIGGSAAFLDTYLMHLERIAILLSFQPAHLERVNTLG